MKLRQLTIDEIKTFSKRKGVKVTAAENFLMSMGDDEEIARNNLRLDSGRYKWDGFTHGAILEGIELAVIPGSRPEPHPDEPETVHYVPREDTPKDTPAEGSDAT